VRRLSHAAVDHVRRLSHAASAKPFGLECRNFSTWQQVCLFGSSAEQHAIVHVALDLFYASALDRSSAGVQDFVAMGSMFTVRN
jgi:hypothetical protein